MDPKVALKALLEFGIFYKVEEQFVIFSIELLVQLMLFTCGSRMERKSALKAIVFLAEFALEFSFTPFVVVRGPINCSLTIWCWAPVKVLISINAQR